MQAPVTSGIKSRPIYLSVDIDNSVKNHLFIAEQGADGALQPLFQYCASGQKSFVVIDRPSETVTTQSIPKDKQQSLLERFSALPVSTHLYLSGMTESFLWDIRNLALAAGMTDEQVKMLPPLTPKRRLFCTHCYTVTENVSHSPFECPNCHRLLLVRDHFSRIHSAYVGVMINAEDPREIPEKEEVR